MEENRYQVGEGLELRVEPAFEYEPKLVGGKYVFGRKQDRGFDINLYRQGKLCLSDHDYYAMGELENEVDRETGEATLINTDLMIKLALMQKKNLRRIYDIPFSDMMNLNDSDGESYEFNHIQPGSQIISHAFLIGREDCNREIIRQVLSMQYPQDRFTDKIFGNNLSLYFVDPTKTEENMELRTAILKRLSGDFERILDVSDATIMSLNYGNRLRTVNVPLTDITSAIKTISLV